MKTTDETHKMDPSSLKNGPISVKPWGVFYKKDNAMCHPRMILYQFTPKSQVYVLLDPSLQLVVPNCTWWTSLCTTGAITSFILS
jgi:hypothetical protein